MEPFVIHWGYWAILLGCFLEGETIAVVGGILAHKGLLELYGVMGAAFVGSLVGDQLWYALGSVAGPRFLGRFRRLRAMSKRLNGVLERQGAWFALGFRFVYGIRTVAPLFFGAVHYPARKYVPLNAIGALVWAIVVTMLGWSLGATIEYLLGRVAKVEEVLVVAGVLVIALVWWRRRRSIPHDAGLGA